MCRSFLLVVVSIIVSGLLSTEVFGQSRTVLVEAGIDWIIVDHYPGVHRTEPILISGTAYQRFPDAELAPWDASGASALPVESFLLGIPPSGTLTVEVISSTTERIENFRLARTTALGQKDRQDESIRRMFSPVQRTDMRSSSRAKAGPVHRFRSQEIMAVEISPYEYDVASQVLTKVSNVRLRIRFGASNTGGFVPDPSFEQTFRSLLVNYEQSRNWRLPASRQALSSRTSGRTTADPYTWFVPGRQYYRFSTVMNGIVSLTADDLRGIGLSPPLVDPRAIEVFYKGLPLRLHILGGEDGTFDDSDVVEFFTSRLTDPDGSPNAYSDSSVYWLSIGSGTGPRSALDTVFALPVLDTARFYAATYHREADLFYHYGDGGLPNNNQSAALPEEGWYWHKFLAGNTRSYTVAVDGRYTTNDPDFQLLLRMHSSVFNQTTPNHIIEVRMNGVLIGVDSLGGYQTKTISISGPMSLTQDLNTVEVKSLATGASVNEVFVDWLELRMPRHIRASSDSVLFVPDGIAPGTVTLFNVGEFTSSDVSVYRLDSLGGIEKAIRGTAAPSGPTYTYSFTDTVRSGRRYVALTQARKLSVPALVPRVIGDLRFGTAGADYLVVTAPEFLTDANRLAAYRAQKGIGRTMVVSVRDIYDQFGYGLADPYAIQRFIRAADSLWPQPAPAYVLFMGDANWDYKNNFGTTRRNFVPALGNPVSDVLYVSTDSDPFVPTKFIGRIPCSTAEQAALTVDRIIAYESLPPRIWNKQYLFMVGGFDSVETKRFGDFSESLISQYVSPAPLGGLANRSYRTISQVVTPEEQELARMAVEAGGVWINYTGHGGTDLWGNGIDKPEQLRNMHGLRHVLSDISCSTVRFAEPSIESFSENFFFGGDGGAISFMGSSGFGYEFPLQSIARSMFGQLTDSVRQVGQLLLGAKLNLWGGGSSSLILREAMQQYTLLGDPALKVAIPLKPDYTIDPAFISSDPSVPNESDPSIAVTAVLSNFGLQDQDSVGIRVEETYQSVTETILEKKVRPFAVHDTLILAAPSFTRGGIHLLQFSMDPQQTVSEEVESNNDAEYTLAVNSGSILPILPMPSSEQHPDSLVFVVQNPGEPQRASWGLVVELDTSDQFSGSVLRYVNPLQGEITSTVNVPTGVLADSTLYFWRARFEGIGEFTTWVDGVFRTSRMGGRGWVQQGRRMFEGGMADGLLVKDTLQLFRRESALDVYSAGFDAGNNAVITIDGVNISQGFANRGYNIAVLNQFTGALEGFGAFSIYSEPGDTTMSQPLVQFLDAIPYGRRVIVAISDEGRVSKSESLNQALEACGSAMIRQLTFRGSWAMIGWKGAPIGTVPEARATGTTPVTIYDMLSFQSLSGTLTSPLIGPAAKWGTVGADIDTSAAGTHARLDAVVIHTSGQSDTLRDFHSGDQLIAGGSGLGITGVKLRLSMSSDTLGASPAMTRWWVHLDAPAELAVNQRTVSISADTVIRGGTMTVSGTVHNIGGGAADSVLVVTTVTNLPRGTTLQDTTLIPAIPAGDSVRLQRSFPTFDLGGQNLVRVEVDPFSAVPEVHRSNNIFTLPMFVRADTVAPTFAVTFDGVEIYDGDYVSSAPTIMVDLSDDNPLPLIDPAQVFLELDGRRISLGSAPDSLFIAGTASQNARVIYRPALQRGEHSLSVQVLDVTGNASDSLTRTVSFKVETDPGFLNVVNYPNPFARTTQFTFNLVGSMVPDVLKIRIYTVTGRMIRELEVWGANLRMGFNTVFWDGRDREGNELANGVYLYKVFMNVDGKSEEVIEKLAKVR